MRVINEEVVARYREAELAIFTLGLSEKFNEKQQIAALADIKGTSKCFGSTGR